MHNASIATTENKLARREVAQGKDAQAFGTRIIDNHICNHADLRNTAKERSCLTRWYTRCQKKARRVRPPNVLRFSCRRGAPKAVKKGTISRAEGGQLQAPVGLHLVRVFA